MKKALKILSFFIIFIISKNTLEAQYIWPISEKNAYETKIEYGYGVRTYDSSAYDKQYSYAPFEGYYSNTENHYGVDIAGIKGHEYDIISVVNGTVLTTSLDQWDLRSQGLNHIDNHQRNPFILDGGGYGNYIVIQEDGTGLCFLYAHIKANTITLRNGNRVTIGQKIGEMGSSGDAGHAHLHFEVRPSKYKTTYGMNLIQTTQYGLETLNPIDYIGTNAPIKQEEIVPVKEEKEPKKIVVEKKQQPYIENIDYSDLYNGGDIKIIFNENVNFSEAPLVYINIQNSTTQMNYKSHNGNTYIYNNKIDKSDIRKYGTVKITIKNANENNEFKQITDKAIDYIPELKISNTFANTYYYKIGDIDKNGKINASDATMILQLYSKLAVNEPLTAEEKDQMTRADVNGDGFVNGIDATLVLEYYANNSTGMNKTIQEQIIKCDFNNDNRVTVDDYYLLIVATHNKKYNEKFDLNFDKKVNTIDLDYFNTIINNYGTR